MTKLLSTAGKWQGAATLLHTYTAESGQCGWLVVKVDNQRLIVRKEYVQPAYVAIVPYVDGSAA